MDDQTPPFQPSYDDVSRWLREAHQTNVTTGQRPTWSCSCGAAHKAVSMYTTDARVRAAVDRHLRAQRDKFPACRYCQREARVGDICDSCHEDAKDMSR